MTNFSKLITTTIILSFSFFFLRCSDTNPNTGPGINQVTHPLSDVKIDIPRVYGSDQTCTDPKPADIGCTTFCKPCATFICVKGEWKRFDIDWGSVCGPIQSGESMNICPRVDGLPCPRDCDLCL